MKRETILALLVAAAGAAAGASACSDSSAPNERSVAAFGIQPALDTVTVGDAVLFLAERSDSSVDAWTVSDSNTARLVEHDRGWASVLARAAGTVIVKATRQGNAGQATLVILPRSITDSVTHHGTFVIRPARDTAAIGEPVTFIAERADSTVDQWSVSDTTSARLVAHQHGWAQVLARAAGTVTVRATRQGDSGQATLVVVASARPDTATDPGSSGEWEAIDLGILDAKSTAATGITEAGTIIGRMNDDDAGTDVHGFIYKNGVMRKLPRLAGFSELPTEINASEKIAGLSGDDHSGPLLVVWATPDAAPQRFSAGATHGMGVVALNDRGDIAVTDEVGPGTRYIGELWRNGVVVNLGSLSDSTVPHPITRPTAMNNSGQIVGSSQVALVRYKDSPADDLLHPFLWENGVMRDLGTLAPRPCEPYVVSPADCGGGKATGINASGVVIGYATGSEGQYRAFIWEKGKMRGLSVYPGRQTLGQAINDRGQVVGTAGDTIFFWDNDQAQIVLVDHGAVSGLLLLGANGEVVGSRDIGGEQHVFVWQAGKLTDLGQGQPAAINKRGDIVGSRYPRAAPWLTRATLWRKKHG